MKLTETEKIIIRICLLDELAFLQANNDNSDFNAKLMAKIKDLVEKFK